MRRADLSRSGPFPYRPAHRDARAKYRLVGSINSPYRLRGRRGVRGGQGMPTQHNREEGRGSGALRA